MICVYNTAENLIPYLIMEIGRFLVNKILWKLLKQWFTLKKMSPSILYTFYFHSLILPCTLFKSKSKLMNLAFRWSAAIAPSTSTSCSMQWFKSIKCFFKLQAQIPHFHQHFLFLSLKIYTPDTWQHHHLTLLNW